nr:MAG TPA: hypothetical protein [Caudoviricetes sp.]
MTQRWKIFRNFANRHFIIHNLQSNSYGIKLYHTE